MLDFFSFSIIQLDTFRSLNSYLVAVSVRITDLVRKITQKFEFVALDGNSKSTRNQFLHQWKAYFQDIDSTKNYLFQRAHFEYAGMKKTPDNMRRHQQINIAKAIFTNLHVDLKFSSSPPAGKPSNEVKAANRSKKSLERFGLL